MSYRKGCQKYCNAFDYIGDVCNIVFEVAVLCFFADVISELLTLLGQNQHTIMKSMPGYAATGPTGAIGTSTPSNI